MFNNGWQKHKLLAFAAHCGRMAREEKLPVVLVFDKAIEAFEYQEPKEEKKVKNGKTGN